MALPITSFFAAAFIVMALVLIMRAVGGRKKFSVSVGDGGHEDLARLMRAHANFVETVPFVLVGMVLMELNGAANWWLAIIGGVFLAARVSHAIGMSYRYPAIPFRLVGMAVTVGVFVLVVATLFYQSLFG
ncbi:MAG: MAPEG family protein [Pseudomonadota bacterium]